MDNSRISEIKDLEYQIRNDRKKLEKLESKSYDYTEDGVNELIQLDKLRKVELKNDILRNEQEVRRIQLEEMKQKLSNAYKEGKIDSKQLRESLSGIESFTIMTNTFEEMKNQEFTIERMKITNTNEEQVKRAEERLVESKKLHSSKVIRFMAGYANRLVRKGKISKEDKSEYWKKREVSEKEITEYFEELCEDLGDILKPNTSISKVCTKESIHEILPTSKILDVVRINSETSNQLYQLYQTSNPQDKKVYAIHHLDEKSVDRIDLYCYNTRTGKMEGLCDKEHLPEEVMDMSGNNEKGIKTLSFLGLKLSFYKNEEGKMSVAKNVDGKLKEVQFKKIGNESKKKDGFEEKGKTVGEGQKKLQEMLDKIKNSNEEKQLRGENVNDVLRTADELHQRNHEESIDGNWCSQLLENMREMAKLRDEDIDKAEQAEFTEFKEEKGGRMW